MRPSLVPVLFASTLLSLSASAAPSDPPALLHLQARLSDAGGTPLQGSVSLQLKLYAAQSGGSALWAEAESATAANGVVHLVLGDVTAVAPGLFDGSDRWLGVTVGADPEMTPRLRIGSAPYALHAGSVSKLGATTSIPTGLITSTHIANGAVSAVDIASGAVTSSAIAPGSIGSAALLPSSVTSFAILDGSISNADVSGAAAIAGTKITPGFGSQNVTTLGSIGAGTATPNARIHADATSQVGLLAESDTNNGVVAYAHTGVVIPGVPPVAAVYGNNDAGGDGLQGTTSGGFGAGVRGYSFDGSSYGGWFENDNGVGLYAEGSKGLRATTSASGGDAVWASATATSGSAWGVRGESDSTTGIGVRGEANAISGANYGVYGETSSPAGFGGYFRNTALGTGTYVEGRALGANQAALRVHNPEAASAQAGYFTNASNYHTLVLENTGTGGTLWMKNAGTGTFLTAVDETGQWKFWVEKSGKCVTKVLQILGGSDLSEGFHVSAIEDDRAAAPAPGMVVCIDPAHEGRLIVSSGPYDRTVAGVISGAGGVNPGMLMGQEGTIADGDHPVALCGRVYVWCEADSGSISPGALLTTSAVEGHAMRASDPQRAQGAVIGKAMGSLSNGRGLVLALVNLQ